MEPTDLTIKILQEIRDESRGMRSDINGLRSDMNARFERVDARFEQVDQRFVAVESTLKDLAEQMVMLARGVKSALEVRANVERRLDEHEQRLRVIESREPH